MEEQSIALDVRNITKRFETHSSAPEILKDLSFQVPLGKICVLLGPNGSGKTTLLKILAGLLQATSGTVLINGIDLKKEPRQAKGLIGWMPAEERSGFYGRLTGRENLKFFGTLQGQTEEAMSRTIGNLALQIGLDDELDNMVLKTSGGQKQKMGLARALIHNPPILLLDEPTRNLDPHTMLRFRRLVKDHLTRIQKKTVVISTHLLDEASKLADVLIIIKDGQIMKILSEHELQKTLRSTSVEELYLKTIDGKPS